MKILPDLSGKPDVFLLSKRALSGLGFTIHLADENQGQIKASKKVSGEPDILYFNLLFGDSRLYTTLNIVTNIFSGAGETFISLKGDEESLFNYFKELIQRIPSDKNLEQLLSPSGIQEEESELVAEVA